MNHGLFSRHQCPRSADRRLGPEHSIDDVNQRIFRSYRPNEFRDVPPAIFRLRYDVYCIEREFVPAFDTLNGLEQDAFDVCSTHVGAYTTDETLIGTVRLVQPPRSQGFPFDRYCSAYPDFVFPPHEQCAEVSRLVVRRTHRRSRADSVAGIPGFGVDSDGIHAAGFNAERRTRCDGSPMLLFGMYRELFRHSRAHGVKFWFAAMERSLARSLAKAGLPSKAIGPAANSSGAVALYLFDLDMLMHRLAQENPALGAWFSEKRSSPPCSDRRSDIVEGALV